MKPESSLCCQRETNIPKCSSTFDSRSHPEPKMCGTAIRRQQPGAQTDLDNSPPGRRTVPSVSNLEKVRRHILHAHMVDGTRQAPRLVERTDQREAPARVVGRLLDATSAKLPSSASMKHRPVGTIRPPPKRPVERAMH